MLGAAALALALSGRARVARLERESRRPQVSTPAPSPAARALQNFGMVRFNPYGDIGGDYSFSLALADARGDGVVVTGLYTREQCRIYAKQVAGWESEQSLIDEEREAIARARAGA